MAANQEYRRLTESVIPQTELIYSQLINLYTNEQRGRQQVTQTSMECTGKSRRSWPVCAQRSTSRTITSMSSSRKTPVIRWSWIAVRRNDCVDPASSSQRLMISKTKTRSLSQLFQGSRRQSARSSPKSWPPFLLKKSAHFSMYSRYSSKFSTERGRKTSSGRTSKRKHWSMRKDKTSNHAWRILTSEWSLNKTTRKSWKKRRTLNSTSCVKTPSTQPSWLILLTGWSMSVRVIISTLKKRVWAKTTRKFRRISKSVFKSQSKLNKVFLSGRTRFPSLRNSRTAFQTLKPAWKPSKSEYI